MKKSKKPRHGGSGAVMLKTPVQVSHANMVSWSHHGSTIFPACGSTWSASTYAGHEVSAWVPPPMTSTFVARSSSIRAESRATISGCCAEISFLSSGSSSTLKSKYGPPYWLAEAEEQSSSCFETPREDLM